MLFFVLWKRRVEAVCLNGYAGKVSTSTYLHFLKLQILLAHGDQLQVKVNFKYVAVG